MERYKKYGVCKLISFGYSGKKWAKERSSKMDKKITKRRRIGTLLNLAIISRNIVSDKSYFDGVIKEYEELLKKTDQEIDEFYASKQTK